MRHSALLLLVGASCAGCGLTFGVDAVDRVNQVEAEVGGATGLVVPSLGVDDAVSVCGGGATLVATIRTTEWTESGADPTSLPLDAAFDVSGADATFSVGGGDETVVLDSVDITAPDTFSVDATLSDGDLTVCDFTADVRAQVDSGGLTLQDIDGAITATADSVAVDFTVPIELTTNGAVTGTVSAGGHVLTSGSATLNVVGDQFDTLSLEGDGADNLTVWLPKGLGFTVRIQSDYGAGRVLAGGVDYDSSLEDADPVADGLEFDINGGGPVVDLTAVNATVLVWESGS